MKTKRELIETISIIDGNLSHIESTKKINGTLLTEIERVMDEHAQQEVKKLNIAHVSKSSKNATAFNDGYIRGCEDTEANHQANT